MANESNQVSRLIVSTRNIKDGLRSVALLCVLLLLGVTAYQGNSYREILELSVSGVVRKLPVLLKHKSGGSHSWVTYYVDLAYSPNPRDIRTIEVSAAVYNAVPKEGSAVEATCMSAFDGECQIGRVTKTTMGQRRQYWMQCEIWTVGIGVFLMIGTVVSILKEVRLARAGQITFATVERFTPEDKNRRWMIEYSFDVVGKRYYGRYSTDPSKASADRMLKIVYLPRSPRINRPVATLQYVVQVDGQP